MKNKEILNLGNICGALTKSKQIKFSTIRALNNNSKLANSIALEVQNIVKLGKEKEVTESDIESEIETYLQEESSISLNAIDSDKLDSIQYELIEGCFLGSKENTFEVTRALLILDEHKMLL